MERCRTIEERLEKWTYYEPNTGCWLWGGYVKDNDYGMIGIGDGDQDYVHRVSYKRHNGYLPDGLVLDHKCRIRCCLNPDHLEPVTNIENLKRSPKFKGSLTHCPKGHPYDGGNLYIGKSRYGKARKCRECHRIREVERAAALIGPKSTHCRRGHAYAETLVRTPSGHPRCSTCREIYNASKRRGGSRYKKDTRIRVSKKS
jgi:hypothetical protein